MKILHTADTHIGARQYGFEERRVDFSTAFQRVIDIAIDEKVDAVIHAGDLFDDRTPTAEDLHETLHALFQLKEAGIPFLGVVGNHEQRRGVQWLDLFAKLNLAVHLGAEPYELAGVKFYGLDYSGRREVKLPPINNGVLVCHQMLDRTQSNAELHLNDLINCGAQFVLLGDWHEHEVWRQQNVLVTYSGSTERWSMAEERARGISLIDLESGRLDRRELKTREFLYISEEEDPFKSIDAHRHQMKGIVVCVAIADNRYSIPEIEQHARDRGALAVRIRDRREASQSLETGAPDVQLEYENLDALIGQRLHQIKLSEASLNIDQIIREAKIADSKVDAEVTKLLEMTNETK
jgi:DNA repair exonuclease SbcCD nuclease subunit